MNKFRFSNSHNVTLKNNVDHRFALNHTLEIFEHNAAYTFIPKNGCSTMRFSIAHANGCINDTDDVNWIHANNETFSMTTSSAAKASYTFVILRCPIERLYSAYMDKIVGLTNQAWRYHVSQGRVLNLYELTFDSFLETLFKTPKRQMDIHWRPQSDFLLYQDYDDYFALENFSLIESTLKNKLNLKLIDTRCLLNHDTKRLKVNITLTNPNKLSTLDLLVQRESGFRPDIIHMFNKKNIEIIKTIYHEDFKLYTTMFGSSATMKKLL